jgi:hypothetical protein
MSIGITILKKGIESKHVLSACFFTMKDSYRSVSKYEKNLVNFLHMSKNLPAFEVRVYTDDSGKDFLLKIAESYPSLSVYHYNFDPLREEVGHIGTFGTIVRFLPMFEDLETVWISDIDIPDRFLDKSILSVMDKHKCPVFYDSALCYNERKIYGRKHTIIAYRMIFKIKFPKALLTRFINRLIDGNLKESIELLNKANTHKPPSQVPYGIDELFLNESIYNYLKRHNIRIICNKMYFLGEGILIQAGLTKEEINFSVSFWKNPTKHQIDKYKNILLKKIPTITDKYPCLNELVEKIEGLDFSMEHRFILSGSNL